MKIIRSTKENIHENKHLGVGCLVENIGDLQTSFEQIFISFALDPAVLATLGRIITIGFSGKNLLLGVVVLYNNLDVPFIEF